MERYKYDIGSLSKGKDGSGKSDETWFYGRRVYTFKGGGEIVAGMTACFFIVEGNIEARIGVGWTSNLLDRFSYRWKLRVLLKEYDKYLVTQRIKAFLPLLVSGMAKENTFDSLGR